MSSKPSSKSTARKSPAAPKTAKKPTGDARAAKPRPAPKLVTREPETQAKAVLVSQCVKTKVEPAPPAEFSSEVMEFITAVDTYKRQRGRPFPHLSEVFAIVKSLGYHKSA